MNHHSHYNLDTLPADLHDAVMKAELKGPAFIGQGLTTRVGSDSYGSYIVAKRMVGRKTIWGIAYAKSVMRGHWTEGDMDCSIDLATAQPTKWIVARGTWRRRGKDTGITKWWFCDENGKRFPGSVAKFGWNGAYAYRDPSF